MQHRNEQKMEEIIKFVNQRYFDLHITPSIREIAAEVHLSTSTVHGYLLEMSERGLIDYDGKMIITDDIQQRITGYNRAAILGSIPCGELSMEEEQLEDFVDLPIDLFGTGPLFILRADGDSMTGAGIDPGDLVVVMKQRSARNGQIVVAYVEGEGNTLKRFYMDEKNHRIILHPENPKYKDIVVKECQIQGVVRRIIKYV